MDNTKLRLGWLGLIFLMSNVFGCAVLPTTSNESPQAKGKALFERHCLPCHGAQGKGDGYPFLKPPPADLTADIIQNKTDTMLLSTIRYGHSDTAMGAWKMVLSEAESRDVLAYVRTLRK